MEKHAIPASGILFRRSPLRCNSPRDAQLRSGHLMNSATLWRLAAVQEGAARRGVRLCLHNPFVPNQAMIRSTFVLLGLCAGMPAQTLVKDIRSTGGTNFGSGMLHQIALGGGVVLFRGGDNRSGSELWRTDGTSAGTSMVKDINVGSPGSAPFSFVKLGSTVYFIATTPAAGNELWKTDGTAAGTSMVLDLNLGTGSGVESLFGPVFGSKMLMTANAGTTGYELWISDGTAGGTTLLKDIQPGATSSVCLYFATLSATQVLFSADEGAAGTGREPWTTDGTSAGTQVLKDIAAGSGNSSPVKATVLAGMAYFFATSPAYGYEPWVTDGTSAGTVLLKDINPGAGGTASSITVFGSKLYFQADDGTTGGELWVSDGTPAGTNLLLDIYPGGLGSSPSGLTTAGSLLYFTAQVAVSGRELWRTDGTVAGTFMTKDLSPGLTFDPFTLMTPLSGKLLFVNANRHFCVSDGTFLGTGILKTFVPITGITTTTTSILVDGSVAYFAADDGVTGQEPYKTDGSSVVLIRDIRPPAPNSSDPDHLTTFGNRLLLTVTNETTVGVPWVSDGTGAGTVALNSSLSEVPSYTLGLGRAWFSAYDGGSVGTEPYITDGTPGGTKLLKDIAPALEESRPMHFTEYAGKMYFSAQTSTAGRELYVSDGTSGGTSLFYEFNPGTANGIPTSFSYPVLNVVNGKLLIFATTPAQGTELWSSDGTVAGTSLLIDLNAGSASGISATLTSVANTGAKLFFRGLSPTTGEELYVSDGTAAGTALVKDINVGTATSNPTQFSIWQGKCYFSATNGTSGLEPFVSDGTAAGTMLLADMAAGAASSSPVRFTPAADRLFFVATAAAGQELYVYDGTTTNLVADIRPGSQSGIVSLLLQAVGHGRRVIFGANNGVNGSEYWVSDGTAAGTVMIADTYLGPDSGYGLSGALFAYCNGRGFVPATDGTVGNELYSFSPYELGISEVEAFGSNCVLTGPATIGTSGGAPFAGNASFGVTLSQAAASAPAGLLLNNARVDLPIGSCTIYPSLTPTISISLGTDATGSAVVGLPIPTGDWNVGIQLYFQFVVVEVGGPLLGVSSTSRGLRIRVGRS